MLTASIGAPSASLFFAPTDGVKPDLGGRSCPTLTKLEVVSHPRGGFTHAEPLNPSRTTTRVYHGWWSTRGAARRALPTNFS